MRLFIFPKFVKQMHSKYGTVREGYSTRRSDSYYRSRSQTTGLYCKYHPSNQLHSFCLSSECMLPMCHTCVNIHNQDHIETKTYGNFKDLTQLIRDSISNIQEQQSILEQLSSQYVQDYRNKITQGQKLKEMLYKSRVRMHEEIDKILDKYFMDIDHRINKFEERVRNMYSKLQEQIHQKYNKLDKQRQSLSLSSLAFIQSEAKSSQRTFGQVFQFTPSGTNLSYLSKQSSSLNRRRDSRKMLKTLIEYLSNGEKQKNQNLIKELNKTVIRLKKVDFQIMISWQKLIPNLNLVMQDSLAFCENFQIQAKQKDQLQFQGRQGPLKTIPEHDIQKQVEKQVSYQKLRRLGQIYQANVQPNDNH